MKVIDKFSYEQVEIFKFGSRPIGRPNMFSHIFYFDGLLIDTGHSNIREGVLMYVSNLHVDQIFITHHHEDHTGNLKVVRDHFDCPAYASPQCCEIMKNPPGISFAQRLIWGNYEPFAELETCENEISSENHTLNIVPIPGHAPDMVCLHLKEKGWLFSADLWVSEYIRYFMRTESMAQQINSIRKVLELEFDVLFCSHNPQFKNGHQKLQNKLQFLEDFYGRVSELYRQGYPESSIISTLNLKEKWAIRILSGGALSNLNMVRSVIRDENERVQQK